MITISDKVKEVSFRELNIACEFRQDITAFQAPPRMTWSSVRP